MRVLHLVKTSAGASWALRQMRELVTLGVDVHVALPDEGPLLDKYLAAGVSVHIAATALDQKRPWTVPRSCAAVRALVDELRPDLLHSHFVANALTARLALGPNHRTPRIFQVPGPLHLESTPFRIAEVASAGRSDYWIGSCKWTCQRYVQSGISSQRVFLSYYGSDLRPFIAATGGKLRSELGLAQSTKVVGMVAFMYRPKWYLGQRRGLKGHEDLIDAVASLVPETPDVVCVIVGGAWDSTTYEQSVRDYGRCRLGDRVIFLGTRSDVAELYPDFDVAVHPSHSENLGAAVESLAAGVPTIATDVGGFPDVVQPGVTGWLVKPNSPPDLAQAIRDALTNPEQGLLMARQGQALVKDTLDVRRTAQEVLDIYGQVLSR